MTAPPYWISSRERLLLVDVDVLVYAHAEGAPRHPEYREWLRRQHRARCVFRGARHRERKRVDHDGSGLRSVLWSALAPPAWPMTTWLPQGAIRAINAA